MEHGEDLGRDDGLDLLFSSVLTPRLPRDGLTFVHGFPPLQAALTKKTIQDGFEARFELFWVDLELANGFDELQDAEEQAHSALPPTMPRGCGAACRPCRRMNA